MSHLFALQLPAQKTGDFARLGPLLQSLATSRRGLMLAPFIAALPVSSVSVLHKRLIQMRRKSHCPTNSNGNPCDLARHPSQERRRRCSARLTSQDYTRCLSGASGVQDLPDVWRRWN